MSQKTVYDFKVKDAKGNEVAMDQYKDKVLLVVNVASKCGYTKQYTGLQELQDKYQSQGFSVVGFPCNQFGAQEPGSNEEIQQFCELNFNVKFPVMSKVDVNGEKADPLFKFLKGEAPGVLNTEMIKWNFTKFLVGKDGKVINRFASGDKPEDIAPAIEKLL